MNNDGQQPHQTMSSIRSKAKREVARAFRDLLMWPKRVAGLLFATRRYDRVSARQIVVSSGNLAALPKVAIYLIYPEHGLLPSHLRSLTYIVTAGYAPLVVSNLPLSHSDRPHVLSHCWQLIERPNIGYDFGGYRDAILFLGPRVAALERLAILNDSTWFPIAENNDWLAQAEAAGADFVGAVGNRAFARPAADDDARPDWTFRPAGPSFYYGSFALLLSGAALADADMLRFWGKLRLGQEKRHVVRHGEIAFSQWAMRRGHTHAASLRIQELPDDLGRLSADDLRAVLRNLIVIGDPDLKSRGKTLLNADPSDPDWRARLIGHILKVVARQGPAYALAWFNIFHKGHAFLKKSPAIQDPDGARVTALIADGIGGAAGSEIRAEVALVQAKLNASNDR